MILGRVKQRKSCPHRNDVQQTREVGRAGSSRAPSRPGRRTQSRCRRLYRRAGPRRFRDTCSGRRAIP
eukprot:29602-Pelagococcus_subviridis.AAC.3